MKNNKVHSEQDQSYMTSDASSHSMRAGGSNGSSHSVRTGGSTMSSHSMSGSRTTMAENSRTSVTTSNANINSRSKTKSITWVTAASGSDITIDSVSSKASIHVPTPSTLLTPRSSRPSQMNIRRPNKARSLTWKLNNGGDREVSRRRSSMQQQSSFMLRDTYLDEIYELGLRPYESRVRVTNRSKLGRVKLFMYDIGTWWRRRKHKHHDDIPVFKEQIKLIEGRFGSGIVSFFVFLRWVMLLNILLAIFWSAFVVIPTALYFDYESYNNSFSVTNILDGKNMLAESWMFYGNYQDRVSNAAYFLDLAYVCMIFFTYFGSLFIIFRSIGVAMHSNEAGDSRYPLCINILTTWDYSLTSEDAVKNLSHSIANALKDQISDIRAQLDLEARTTKQKCIIIALRSLAWFITLILVGGGCTAITYLVISVDSLASLFPGEGGMSSFIKTYGTTIAFLLINKVVPIFLNVLPKMERYVKGRLELNITIARIFILRMANLFALIVSLYRKVQDDHGKDSNSSPETSCAGTLIGQELYKLVILDTIIHMLAQLSINYLRYWWTMKKGEFKMSGNVLSIVYRQALLWSGTLTCPVLPLIGVISNLLFFTYSYAIVRDTCIPPTKRWNQSRHSTFFQGLLAATLIMLLLPMALIISDNDVINVGLTSVSGIYCGPFGNANTTIIGTFITERHDVPGVVVTIFSWLSSASIILPVMFIMVSLIYFLSMRLGKEKDKNIILREDLELELGDKRERIKKMKRLKSLAYS